MIISVLSSLSLLPRSCSLRTSSSNLLNLTVNAADLFPYSQWAMHLDRPKTSPKQSLLASSNICLTGFLHSSAWSSLWASRSHCHLTNVVFGQFHDFQPPRQLPSSALSNSPSQSTSVIDGYLPKGHDLGLQVSQEVSSLSVSVQDMTQILQESQPKRSGFKSTHKPCFVHHIF